MKTSKMKTKLFAVLVVTFLPMKMYGQWRLGAMFGMDWNRYSINKQANWSYEKEIGGTAGVMGQYDIKDWLGIRAEVNWTMKDAILHDKATYMSCKMLNHYMQLPIMVSLSLSIFRNMKLFSNLGAYGGYLLSSYQASYHTEGRRHRNLQSGYIKYEFNDNTDQRLDYGLVGGIGGEYRIVQHWGVQLEFRYYHSLQSISKEYMMKNYPLYNNTCALQAAVYYYF